MKSRRAMTPLHREKKFPVTWCGLKRRKTKRRSTVVTCLNGLAFEAAKKTGGACKSCDRAIRAESKRLRSQAKSANFGRKWYGG